MSHLVSYPDGAPEGPPITLEVFSGPLDLLLHLIKKEEVSIYEIPIVRICDQFNEYLREMGELDLAVAGEFLWMASWLLQMKSQLLLPAGKKDADDPREELVERLLEYRRVKELASMLHASDLVRRFQWAADIVAGQPEGEVELDWEDVDLGLLARAYLEVMERHAAAYPPPLKILPLRFKVEDKMREMYARVQADGVMPLLRHLLRHPDANEVVALFVAALELTRLGGVFAEQRRPFSEIYLRYSGKVLDPSAFFENIDNGS